MICELSMKGHIEFVWFIDVLHRSKNQDSLDTRAYSLTIGYEQMNIWDDLMVARKILYYAISKKEYDELDDSGILDFG